MKEFKFNFMGARRITSVISSLLIIVSIFSLSYQGLNLGIDFTGGTLVEVGYSETVDLVKVRESFSNSNFSNATIQYFGSAKEILREGDQAQFQLIKSPERTMSLEV